MNKNIECLIKACLKESLKYEIHHSSNNLISLKLNGVNHIFVNWMTPLNSQSVMQLCQDKGYFYSYFENVIKMPKTSSFLNPYSNEKYRKYLKQKTIFDIINAVETEHAYPIIVKKNRGSRGTKVFIVYDRNELEKAILDIFNLNSAACDYMCLVQDFIKIKEEFRVIYLEGKYQFSYKKNIEGAINTGNLSPLHWQGAKAELVRDFDVIQKLEEFCAPIFSKLMIPFCGLDVALDQDNSFWLIETNTSPGFDCFIKHEGDDVVVGLYQEILRDLTISEK